MPAVPMIEADYDLECAVGRRVKQRRKVLNVTQKTLAAGLGVTYQQIQKYESGESRFSASTLVRIADMLCVSVSELVGENPGTSRGTKELIGTAELPGARELLDLYSQLSSSDQIALKHFICSIAR